MTGYQTHVPFSEVVRRINFEGISEDEKIRVFLRIKPLSLSHITDEINSEHYRLDGNTFVAIRNSRLAEICHEFSFNAIIPPTASQSDVFDLAVRERLEEVLLGSEALLFAYGTTSSGKSYTIQGKGSEPGIIPRVLYLIFASIGESQDRRCNIAPSKANDVTVLQRHQVKSLEKEKHSLLITADGILYSMQRRSANDSIRTTSSSEMAETLESVIPIKIDKENCAYSIWISFVEIYNECIFDLLVPIDKSKEQLKIAFDEEKRAYLKGVKYMCVSSWEEAYKLYLFGKHNLHVSPTSLNKKSSRSHCVLSIKIIQRPLTDDNSYFDISSLSVCDLAGSERQGKTKNVGGARMKESQNINTSILVLNRCFDIIRANQNKRNQEQLVPFRESKLTLLFNHALAGNGSITMITNISQSDELIPETHQVLKATSVASQIKAKAFTKKTYSRRSVFTNYCSTRVDIPTEILDSQEGVGSSLVCRSCLEYEKEILHLKEILKQKDKMLCEEKEKSSEREQQLRNELVDTFTKMLDDSEMNHKKRLELQKKEHRKELEEVRASYKAYYEVEYREAIMDSSFQQMKKTILNEKLIKLCELFNIPIQSEIDEAYILDQIIQIKCEQPAENDAEQAQHGQVVSQLQGELIQLKRKIKTTGEMFNILSDETEESIHGLDILSKIHEEFLTWKTRYSEQERLLTAGVNDYKELESYVKKMEREKVKLEEDIAIKEQKILDLHNDVINLNALLADKNSEQKVETEPVVVKLENLTLNDDEEEHIPQSVSKSAKKSTRRRRLKTFDSESDDPSFFLPAQPATTGKKKKRTTTAKKKQLLLEVPPSSFSQRSESAEECGNSSTKSAVKARRKLYRKESLHLEDDEPFQIQDPVMSQQSPNSFMKSLRPRK